MATTEGMTTASGEATAGGRMPVEGDATAGSEATAGARALLTDLYQLTMAQGYWRGELADEQACFYLHFRENPFAGGYSIACGLAQVIEFVESFSFTDEDCAYLATINVADGRPLFGAEFLGFLRRLRLTVSIDAVPEGTVVFPYEPILRVTGPVMQCQLIETGLLNMMNFQTLIATKAARVCEAAKGPVAEFGLRRAQGPAGGLWASRAAYVGGCNSTSNLEAGRLFGLPVSGTHAHSWVMAHRDELTAFREFVQVYPHNSILLVDTYDVTAGIKNAITVAKEMEQRGQRLMGIRLDSGDLAWLSIKARELLDAAGLSYVHVVASNDLDEHTIQSLLSEQKARIDLWGVGTKLVTAWEQPALSGVYKLSATRMPGDAAWMPQLKVSEQAVKSSLPGLLAVRRYYDNNSMLVGDMIYDEQLPPADDWILDPQDSLRRKDLSGFDYLELLQPYLRDGCAVVDAWTVEQARQNTLESLKTLHSSNKRLLNPHTLPVGLERSLFKKRDEIIRKARALD